MNPRPLLQLEGAAVLIVSLLFYHWSQGSWLQFALLFLLPDLSMLGYAANIRVGAITYNAVHTYVGPPGVGWLLVRVESPGDCISLPHLDRSHRL